MMTMTKEMMRLPLAVRQGGRHGNTTKTPEECGVDKDGSGRETLHEALA